MDAVKFQSNWTMLQPCIREKWNKFTDEDLKLINGKQEIFFAQLQKKYGFNREQATKELASLEAKVCKGDTARSSSFNPNTPPFGKNKKS